jgi:hypothetical protein
LKFQFVYIIFFVFNSCKNKPAELVYDANLSDSLRMELYKDTLLDVPDSAYSKLLFAAWDSSAAQQLHYHVNDYHAYMDHLISRFEKFLDTTRLTGAARTNEFFKDGANTTSVLYYKLEELYGRWRQVAESSLSRRMKRLAFLTFERFADDRSFMHAYFYNQQPEEAVRTLKSFDKAVKVITYDALTDDK